MKRMTAVFPVVTAVALAAGSVWAGARGEEASGSGSGSTMVTPPGTFPIVEEPITLTVFAQQHALIENIETNELTLEYEQSSNVHIDWDTAPGDQIAEKRNLMIASGDLPDVFMYAQINSTEMVAFGSQGLFHPLQDVIEEYGLHVKQLFAEKPHILQDLTAPDGNLYALPQGAECTHCVHQNKMFLYRPWMEKLGIWEPASNQGTPGEFPSTTEELFELLLRFKNEDPNGNGKADEIPFAGAAINRSKPWHFLLNSFLYWDDTYTNINNGTVSFVADSEELRSGLRYLKRLYDNGLLADESFTQNRNNYIAMGENPEVNILGGGVGTFYGVFTNNFGPSGRFKEWTAIAPLEGPDGTRWAFTQPYRVEPHTLVTTAYANPEVVVRWADWFYSPEGHHRRNTGHEGIDWRRAEPGEYSYTGNPAEFYNFPHVTFSMQNNRWMHLGPHFNGLEARETGASTQELIEIGQERWLWQWTLELYRPFAYEEFMPNLIYGEENALEMGRIQPEMTSAVESAIARFVTGSLDLDRDWSAYQRELQAIGKDRYVALIQAAYDTKVAALGGELARSELKYEVP